mmetsp:Transcript_15851/g.36255  ORF Transcript_15851/g.36255 Transcript_15851/m.36255 type:complete len:85 (-) Transcript_15851:312-566(-)
METLAITIRVRYDTMWNHKGTDSFTSSPGTWLAMNTSATPPELMFVATASINTQQELLSRPRIQNDLRMFAVPDRDRAKQSLII